MGTKDAARSFCSSSAAVQTTAVAQSDQPDRSTREHQQTRRSREFWMGGCVPFVMTPMAISSSLLARAMTSKNVAHSPSWTNRDEGRTYVSATTRDRHINASGWVDQVARCCPWAHAPFPSALSSSCSTAFTERFSATIASTADTMALLITYSEILPCPIRSFVRGSRISETSSCSLGLSSQVTLRRCQLILG